MYAIILWQTEDYVTFIHNRDGSIMLFATLDEADEYANEVDKTVGFDENEDCRTRVVSLDGIE